MSFFKGHQPPEPPASPKAGNGKIPQGPAGPSRRGKDGEEESETVRKAKEEAERGIRENVIEMKGWEDAALGELRTDVEKTYSNKKDIGEDHALHLIRQKLSEVSGRLEEDMRRRFADPKAEQEVEDAEKGLPNPVLTLKKNPTPEEERQELDAMLDDSLKQIDFVMGLIDAYFSAKEKGGEA